MLFVVVAEGYVTFLLCAFGKGQRVEDINTDIGGVFACLKGRDFAAFHVLCKLREDGLVIDKSFCGLALIIGQDGLEDALSCLLSGLVLQQFEAFAGCGLLLSVVCPFCCWKTGDVVLVEHYVVTDVVDVEQQGFLAIFDDPQFCETQQAVVLGEGARRWFGSRPYVLSQRVVASRCISLCPQQSILW